MHTQASSSHSLILTSATTLASETYVNIYVDTDAGILLPPAGVQLNERMGIASTAKNGPLPMKPPTYFDFVAPIGSFQETCEIDCVVGRARSLDSYFLVIATALKYSVLT